jgi:hypothetical protein
MTVTWIRTSRGWGQLLLASSTRSPDSRAAGHLEEPVATQYSQSAYSAWRVFMSSNKSTMRSMYQSLPPCTITMPAMTGNTLTETNRRLTGQC